MRIEDLFEAGQVEISCHTGGAKGADTEFELLCAGRGIPVYAYSWKTDSHRSPNKVEISRSDFEEGSAEVRAAARTLCRTGASRYMNLLARNWAQVKYSRQVFAVSTIVSPGGSEPKGRVSKARKEVVAGGTGYAVEMAISHCREVYVFDQCKECWFRWSYSSESFVRSPGPVINQPFAGIGTRELNEAGLAAISELFDRSFGTM